MVSTVVIVALVVVAMVQVSQMERYTSINNDNDPLIKQMFLNSALQPALGVPAWLSFISGQDHSGKCIS